MHDSYIYVCRCQSTNNQQVIADSLTRECRGRTLAIRAFHIKSVQRKEEKSSKHEPRVNLYLTSKKNEDHLMARTVT